MSEQDAKRRRKYILAMEAMAIILCVGVLVVAMTIAQGLGGGALEWAAKIFAVAVLAIAWKAIPGIYDRHFDRRR